MATQSERDDYPDEEAQRRFEAALRAALNTPPKPVKDRPRERPVSKGVPGKQFKPSS